MNRNLGRFLILILKAGVLLGALSCAEAAEDEERLANWFNDPFVRVRDAVPDCPEPLGPRLTQQDATLQEHYRVERGTSCYLAGECSKPNAYLYDAPIAAAIEQLFKANATLAHDSSLWVTVTRRFVYLEGCSRAVDDISKAESMIRAIADVQLVLVNVARDPHDHLPYKPLSESAQAVQREP